MFGEALSYGAYEIVEPTPMSGFGNPVLPVPISTVRPVALPGIAPLSLQLRPIQARTIVPMAPMPRLLSIPQIGFEQKEGLWFLSQSAAPLFRTILAAMTYTVNTTSGSSETGQASPVVGQTSGNALLVIEDKINTGQVALVEKASLPTGTLRLVFTKDATLVANLAGGDAATHASLSDTPTDILQAAVKILAEKPPGVPGEKLAEEKPKWLVPVLIGAGVLVVAVIAFAGKKAKANPKRRRRLGPRYAKVCVCEKRVVNPRRRRKPLRVGQRVKGYGTIIGFGKSRGGELVYFSTREGTRWTYKRELVD